MTADQVAVGVDVGTGGVRALAVTTDGTVTATSEVPFPAGSTQVTGARVEQKPQLWRETAEQALQHLVAQLDSHTDVIGVAVDATSGTFLLVDQHGNPLTPGIMYNDQRAVDVTPEVASLLQDTLKPYGIQIGSSFALPKIVHLLRERDELRGLCHQVVHQTDWVVGTLTDDMDATDISTALKSGANPGSLHWPKELQQLGIAIEWLPRVVLPGTPIGQVSRAGAQRTGLRPGTPVFAGCTDGTAGCLASGARSAGQLNVTLGTTLVFKAISPHPIVDASGAIYNHRHPAGGYLPGAASSTGGDWIDTTLPGSDLDRLGAAARRHVPTRTCVYPLVKRGERFPFVCPAAEGFGLESIEDPACRLAAGMEAVALLERMAIEQFEHLGLPIDSTVFATGGGARSDLWLQIRASANRRCYSVPENAACAMGAAVLAAAHALGSCEEAVSAMIRCGHKVEPVEDWIQRLDESYHLFRTALQERGYCEAIA